MEPTQLKLNQRIIQDFEVTKNEDGSEDREYVLDLNLRKDNAQIASVLSNGSISIINGFTYQPLRVIKTTMHSIIGIQYQEENPYNLFICDSNGTFQIWDSNSGLMIKAYEFCVPTFSFTVLCGGSLLVLGSEGSILFVNLASGDLVGKYKDVHSEPVTQLISHPLYNTVFASGSEDGLICVFDMSRGSQDDSLITILNVESAVDKIGWWGENNEMLWCITMTRGVYLFNTRTSELIQNVVDCSVLLQEQNILLDTIVTLLFTPDNTPIIVACDSQGVLYLIQFNNNIQLLNTLPGHKDILRCACVSKNNLITGSEDSSICIWSKGYQIQSSSVKTQRNHRLDTNKPYAR